MRHSESQVLTRPQKLERLTQFSLLFFFSRSFRKNCDTNGCFCKVLELRIINCDEVLKRCLVLASGERDGYFLILVAKRSFATVFYALRRNLLLPLS